MEVIPVLDVCGGVAVHARGGDRSRYAPVVSVLAEGSDPLALARAYRDRLGARSCYLADLDAIAGAPPDLDGVRAISRERLRLWVDAGIRDADTARAVLAAGARRAVVGLETLPEPGAFASIAAAAPPDSLAFSLDLRDGAPVATAGGALPSDPLQIAWLAYEAGFRTLIVLDLGRIGRGEGPDCARVPPLRRRLPRVSVYLGGGVRNADDLRRCRRAGCAGALVATALHRGDLTREHLTAGFGG